jgi:hypothetical protein
MDDADLRDLAQHWGDAYEITVTGTGWCAKRRDDQAILSAATAEELRRKIRDDYAFQPVRRP